VLLQHVVTMVGSIAALCSMVSFTPQAWKIIRTRETKDISAGMYSLTVSAFAFWCLYGALLREWPLIVSNGVCLALSGFILAMTLLPQRKKEAVADAIEDSKAAVLPVPGDKTRNSVAERNGG
jgi:MtN3 and saliva related transmembrane protein